MAAHPIARAGAGQPRRSGPGSWRAAAIVWGVVASGAFLIASPRAQATSGTTTSPGEADVESAQRRCEVTERELEQARGRGQAARLRLESYVSETFDRLRSTARALGEALPVPSEEIATPSPAARRAEVRLEELMAEHAQLLERLTPEHPRVRDLERRIADAQEQWHRSVANAPPRSAVDRPPTVARETLWTPSALEEVIAGYDQARQSVEQSARDLDEAQQRHASATRQLSALVESLWQQAHARPVAEAARATAWPVWPSVLGLGLLTVGSGLGVWKRTSARLSSVGQIEQLLRVPVVALLPGRWPAAAPAGSSTAMRSLRLGGQLIVALLVFFLVAASIDTPSWILSLVP